MSDDGANVHMGHATISPRDHMEIMQYMNHIKAMAEGEKDVSSLCERCFNKCITSPIEAGDNGKLDETEKNCVKHCVNGFLGARGKILKHLPRVTTQVAAQHRANKEVY